MGSSIPVPGKSLKDVCPEIAKQWNYEINGELYPENVTPFSNKKVSWICDKGKLCKHVWSSKISDMTNGHGCPFCAGKQACLDNCLATLRPDIASQWDYSSNDDITPYTVTCGSKFKAT
jgi:hypothetical protein